MGLAAPAPRVGRPCRASAVLLGSDGSPRRAPRNTFLKYKRTSSNTRNARKLRPRSKSATHEGPPRDPGALRPGEHDGQREGRFPRRGPSGRARGLHRRTATPAPVLALRAERAARPGGGATAHNGRGPGFRRGRRASPAGRRSVAGSKAPPQPRPHLHPGSIQAGAPGPGSGSREAGEPGPGCPPPPPPPPAPTGTHR